MSSSEESSSLENDKENNTQSGDEKGKIVDKGGSSDVGSLVKENVAPREGRSESRSERGGEGNGQRDKINAKGKSREECKRKPKGDASEDSHGSPMSPLSLSDAGKAGDMKRKSEKKTDKKGRSHKVKRHKDRGDKRRRSRRDSHGRSGSHRRSESHGRSQSRGRSGSNRSGESLYSRHSRDRKERKRKEVKKRGKHKLGAGAVGGGGERRKGGYTKLSSFSISNSHTDPDMDLESLSDLNYKSHNEKRQKKIQKKGTSDYLSSKNHHHRYDEEKGGKKKREDDRRGSSNLGTKKKNGSRRGPSREPSYSVSLSSEEESKKRKKRKKKLADDRSGRRARRGSSEEHTYKHNSRVELGGDKFNYAKDHYWRGNSGGSRSEEHHKYERHYDRDYHRDYHRDNHRDYHQDDGRSPLGIKHSQRGTTKGHTNTLEGDQKRGSQRRRVERKENKMKKENKACKANRNGRGSDAEEYESTMDSSSYEVKSRSSHIPTRKKRRDYFSDAQSADLTGSFSTEERYRAKGRMPHDGTVMVPRGRERIGGRKGADGIHHNFHEDEDTFLYPRWKRGDPFREGRPRMTEEEEEAPRFRDRDWQPYGGTHHREIEKRKKYGEREDRTELLPYGQMGHPYRHGAYDQMEYKKEVAVLIKNRRPQHHPDHGIHSFDEGRGPNGLIDREKTCPFLLRLFYKLDDEYNDVEDVRLSKKSGVQSNELQIYGWLDITMREIVTLVKDFYQESRKRDAHWIFKVYSNEKKQLTFLSRVHSTKYNYREDNKTLLSLDYEIGDILLLSIMFEGQAA
ncbi:hypothetical protein C922_02947 [Plasmodium inui San Antonio 1]|uniref:Histone deacetylase complex subunit SAP18 n=1 Tax=Plasmodium inui San Antonio 1 TaxID=1237626 RepID=W7AMU5_9APIC|nr:hypothetical protein C922_02947 [Plasmodium inui San Antonio 1]EUD66626.1 hypothetical protein C922_02947 [Plasmodium inui San Antonio 1]